MDSLLNAGKILAIPLFFGMTFRAGRSSKVARCTHPGVVVRRDRVAYFGEHSSAGNDPLATLVGFDFRTGKA